MLKKISIYLAVPVLMVAAATASMAKDLPPRQLKVVGLNGSTPVSIIDEMPFWKKTIPHDSHGKITVSATPLDRMGINDKTMLRLLKLGVMDFAGMDISKMAGDDPVFEGCDLAGLALTPDEARKACEAYRSVIDKRMQKNWNSKLLAFGANTPQVFWCRGNVHSLADLKGKKIRVFNNTMRDFLSGLPATAINMAFAEVVPALNNGVVDCAVTGSLSGNTAGWNEVVKTIYPMSLGWSINALAVNLNTWNSFDPATKKFFLKEAKAYENKMWRTVKATTAEAIACNTGHGTCKLGKVAHTTVAKVSKADEELYRKIVKDKVVPGWAKRCGAACVAQWNKTVGKVLHITASVK